MRKGQIKKLILGVLFLLGALALLLGKLGYLKGLGFWSVFFSIILLGIALDGIFRKSFGEILFPIAGIIIIHDELFHLEAITPWPVLGAALLGTIGLNFIIPKRNRWKGHKGSHYFNGISSNGDDSGGILSGEEISYEVSFGDAIKYISGQDVSRVFLECSFGNLEVYFNDAVLKENKAHVIVECSFGEMGLYVPVGWRVSMNVENSFSGIEEEGSCDPDGENTLFVEGEVSFGHLMVHYV